MPYVAIKIQGLSKGTTSRENGFFKIEGICNSEIDLEFSHIGYKTKVHHHHPHHDSMSIYLAIDETLLESIIVEGKFDTSGLSSIQKSSISTKELERIQFGLLGEMLGKISGINTISTGQNIIKPVIHGLHTNKVLIINNGVRHEFQNWGTDHAAEIDPSLIGSIEVIKGAATVRYGSDAMGGVILIEPPKLDLDNHLHADISVTGQSNGRSGETSIQLNQGFKHWAIGAQGSLYKQGDLQAPTYNLTNTSRGEYSFAVSSLFHLEKIDIETYYSRFEQDLGILRGSVTGNLEDLVNAMEREVPQHTNSFSYSLNTPRQATRHDLFKTKGTIQFHNHRLALQYNFQENWRREFDIRRGSNNEIPSINLKLRTHSADATWYHPVIGELSGMLGAQVSLQDNNNLPGTNTVPFIPNFNQSKFGIFLIESWGKGNTTYEAGLRYDFMNASVRGREPNNDIYRQELSFNNVTATLGLAQKLNETSTFRINIGTAWRPPNISELYAFGKHQAVVEYGVLRYQQTESVFIDASEVFTPEEKDLKAESGIKLISSYEVAKENFQAELTAYANLIRNFFNSQPAGITNTVRGAFPYFTYRQNDAFLWGFDFDGKWQHHEKWESSLRGNLVWAKDISNGDVLIGMPTPSTSYELKWQAGDFFMKENVFNVEVQHTFKAFQLPLIISANEILEAQLRGENLFELNNQNFDFLEVPNAYTLLHFGWSGRVGKIGTTLQIRNLLNTQYRNYTNKLRYFADEMGRNFIFTLRYKI